MKTLQLLSSAGLITMAIGTAACNRSLTQADAREAAREVKIAAARASNQLSDSWLTTKIQTQYFADDDIKARFINVTSDDGVVVLKGRVDNENAHQQAVQIARNTDGVKDVQDQLAVGATPGGEIPDQMTSTWITTKIQAKYFADPQVRGRDINVSATNGVVTLAGQVESEAQRQQAISIARSTDGVTSVEDRLVMQPPAPNTVATSGTVSGTPTVTEHVDDARITATIQSKFFVDEMVKGRRIDVDTDQGVVTLRGEVASESERAQAVRLARTTDGVQRVEDSLTVPSSASAESSSSSSIASSVRGAGTEAAEKVNDALLTTKIQSKFFVDNRVHAGSIDVSSKNGVVTLEGTASSSAAKQRALTIARETDGVKQVIDRITLKK